MYPNRHTDTIFQSSLLNTLRQRSIKSLQLDIPNFKSSSTLSIDRSITRKTFLNIPSTTFDQFHLTELKSLSDQTLNVLTERDPEYTNRSGPPEKLKISRVRSAPSLGKGRGWKEEGGGGRSASEVMMRKRGKFRWAVA